MTTRPRNRLSRLHATQRHQRDHPVLPKGWDPRPEDVRTSSREASTSTSVKRRAERGDVAGTSEVGEDDESADVDDPTGAHEPAAVGQDERRDMAGHEVVAVDRHAEVDVLRPRIRLADQGN